MTAAIVSTIVSIFEYLGTFTNNIISTKLYNINGDLIGHVFYGFHDDVTIDTFIEKFNLLPHHIKIMEGSNKAINLGMMGMFTEDIAKAHGVKDYSKYFFKSVEEDIVAELEYYHFIGLVVLF